jgi:hypothetical protein
MQPVQPFVTNTGEIANNVVFASKEKYQGELANSDDSTPKGDIFLRKATCEVESVEAKDHQCDGVRHNQAHTTNGR